MDKQADRLIYYASNLKTAENVRRLLLQQRPRPCVYVYNAHTGYSIHVASEYGSHPNNEYVKQLKQILNKELSEEEDVTIE